MERNVVLLILDSVRRDLAEEEMTALHDSADISLMCRAASSWSVPSHASLLNGQLPHEHGVHVDNFDYTTLEDSFVKQLDHRSLGVSANGYASSTFGFDTHFDTFHDVRPNRYFADGMDVNQWLGSDERLWKAIASHDRHLRSLANVAYLGTKHVSQRLPFPALIDEGLRRQCKTIGDESDPEPFFLFANIMDAHRPMFQHIGLDTKVAPYRWTSRSVGKWDINTSSDPNTEFASYLETYRNLYRASLRYIDRHVDRLIAELEAQTERETTVIVTADHGEGLVLPGDNGIIDHTGIFTDSVLEVPFLVYNPPADFSPEFVSHLDVPEIVTQMASGTVPDIDREWAPSEVIGAMNTPDENAEWWDRTSRCLWNPDQTLVWDSVSDTTPPDESERYFGVPIDACRTESDHHFDTATRAQLENLGYL